MERTRHQLQRFPNGTSIFETTITVFIFAIITGIIATMFIVTLRTYFLSDGQTQLVVSASHVTQEFAQYVNEATAVVASRTIGATTYTTGQGAVVLKLASLDTNGNAVANTYDYVVFTTDPADATHFIEIVDGDAASVRTDVIKLLASNVAQVQFTYRNADPTTTNDVSVSIQLTRIVQRTHPSYYFSTYAKLRNT